VAVWWTPSRIAAAAWKKNRIAPSYSITTRRPGVAVMMLCCW
jgi:hypothetical protein